MTELDFGNPLAFDCARLPAGAADPVGSGSARPRRPGARSVPARPRAPVSRDSGPA